jgi:hypothetical protein
MGKSKKKKEALKKAWKDWQSKKRKYSKLYNIVSAALARRKYLYHLWQKHKNAKIIFLKNQALNDAKLPFYRRLFMKYKRDLDKLLKGVDSDLKTWTTTDFFFAGLVIILAFESWWNS